MRRLVLAMLVVAVLPAAAACGSAAPVAAPSSPATATPTALSTAELQSKWAPVVEAVSTAMKRLGSSPKSETLKAGFNPPCGVLPTATRWAEQGLSFVEAARGLSAGAVAAYEPELGTKIVDDVRAAVTTCPTWHDPNDLDWTTLGSYEVTRPAGVDNITAYCLTFTFASGPAKGQSVFVCQAVMSRGHVVVSIGGSGRRQADATAGLNAVVGPTAAALTAGVPTP